MTDQWQADQARERELRAINRLIERSFEPTPPFSYPGGPNVDGLDLRDEFEIDHEARPEDVSLYEEDV